MARVVLASGLARWLHAGGQAPSRELALEVPGETLGIALESVFERHPVLRGYVVDEHGTVRHHVAVFIDGQSITDKARLDLPLAAQSEVYVMQALSGG